MGVTHHVKKLGPFAKFGDRRVKSGKLPITHFFYYLILPNILTFLFHHLGVDEDGCGDAACG